MYHNTAGILIYRLTPQNQIEFFLIHHGHPSNKRVDFWSIPKGKIEINESPLQTARREFMEEIGLELQGELLELTPIQKNKMEMIYAWACSMEINPKSFKSKELELEQKGRTIKYYEVDKAGWFSYEEAKQKINPKQEKFIDELMDKLSPKS